MLMAAARYAYLDHFSPIAIAHRGGGEDHPENSLPAIAQAVDLGYRYVEIDIRATRDGVPVLFHDEMLDRMAGIAGRIEDLSWSEVQALSLQGEAAIPRLEEVLATWPSLRIALDIKSDRAIEPVAALVRARQAQDRVSVGAVSQRRAWQLRRVFGNEVCHALGSVDVLRLRLASIGLPVGAASEAAAQVPSHHRGIPIVDRAFLRAAHARDIRVHVWTVNLPAEIEGLLDLGIDGVMTNRLTLLKEILLRRGQWPAEPAGST